MSTEMKEIIFLPTEEYVKVLGRTVMLDGCRLLSLSASGVEFSYVGTRLCVSFYGDSSTSQPESAPQPWRDQSRVGVIVDGRMQMILQITKQYQMFEVCGEGEMADQEHVVRIIKLSEPRMSSVGLGAITVMAHENPKPTPKTDKYIEFIGDSITCGYGIDTPDELYHFSTSNENVSKAYSYLTTQKLGMDYSLVSYSGHGLISGYTPDPNVPKLEELIQPYYEILSYSYNTFRGKGPQEYKWDFSLQPDVVVINLGTNDESYIAQEETKRKRYEDAYVEFLKKVHNCNPKAKIVCAYGVMGDFVYPSQEAAVARFKEDTGYMEAYNCRFPVQNPEKDGYAADYHPSGKTHEMIADILADFIKKIL